MSSSNKAKQKLMESMRMTKASPGKKIKEVDKGQNIAQKETKSVKPKKKVSAKKKSPVSTQNIAVDPYQSARRIWPD